MEVYLPIHYVYSGTQEGKKTGYEVYFTYDNRGLLLEKEFYDVITKKHLKWARQILTAMTKSIKWLVRFIM